MKKRIFALLAVVAALGAASCGKEEEGTAAARVEHGPLWSTVWENNTYESPSGGFTSYMDRLLFWGDTTGEVFASYSTIYWSGNLPNESWDTTVAMTYRLDTASGELWIDCDYVGNPRHLRYDPGAETLTVVDRDIVYKRVM